LAIPGSEVPVGDPYVSGAHQAPEVQKLFHGLGTLEHSCPLRLSPASDTDPMDLDIPPSLCVKTDQETRVRLGTPAGQHDRPEVDVLVGSLLEKLSSSLYIPQGTERRVIRRQMDHIRTLSLGRQLLSQTVQGTVCPGLVFALRIGVDFRAKQTIEEDIPRPLVFRWHAPHPILELDHTTKAELGCGCGCAPGVIRLDSTCDEDRGSAPGNGFAEIELQLADLVTAHCETGAIVSLHEETFHADGLREVGHGLQRSRAVGQRNPREFRETFQRHEKRVSKRT
jgi:hypothetical protein